jgi:hypothetical protein
LGDPEIKYGFGRVKIREFYGNFRNPGYLVFKWDDGKWWYVWSRGRTDFHAPESEGFDSLWWPGIIGLYAWALVGHSWGHGPPERPDRRKYPFRVDRDVMGALRRAVLAYADEGLFPTALLADALHSRNLAVRRYGHDLLVAQFGVDFGFSEEPIPMNPQPKPEWLMAWGRFRDKLDASVYDPRKNGRGVHPLRVPRELLPRPEEFEIPGWDNWR